MYKIKTQAHLGKVMRTYFEGLAEAPLVAWCTSVGPAELLRSFGFEVYFPENHGALLGATRSAMDYIPEAQKCGFSGHVCSYTTADIGAWQKRETPLTQHYGLESIPKPDLIVYNTNQCREVEDWFSFFAREFDCPIIGIHPPRHLDEVGEEEVRLVAAQFKRMIPVCEQVSGRKFDVDRFKEVLGLSQRATLLWQQVLRTSAHSPAPLSFFDGTIHMGPIVVMRGTEAAMEYYKVLLAELEESLAAGRGFVENERCRIFWDGMPVWGKLRSLSELFAENQAAVVASTYCNSWIFEAFDETAPFESSARAYTEIFINRSEKAKMAFFKRWMQEYRIDGMIFHDAKTCFNNSNSRFGMPQRFQEETGIPALVVEGDLCDLRFFSEGQTITRIETFIEQLQDRNSKKKMALPENDPRYA